jgi:hypothetical protein
MRSKARPAGKTLIGGKRPKPGKAWLAEREGTGLLAEFEPGRWH